MQNLLLEFSAVPFAGTAASIQLSPTTASLNDTSPTTVQLTAIVRDALGRILSNAVTWSTGDAAKATVSVAGLVTYVGTGSVTITATSGAASATCTVTLTAATGATVQILLSPSTKTLTVAAPTQTFTAVAKDINGVATGDTCYFVSSDTSKVTVDSTSGLATRIANGTATINAVLTPPTLSLAARVALAFGGNAHVPGIFLHSVGITDDGTGHCSLWQDARGGSYPTFAFASGHRPAIDGTTGYLVFSGNEYGTYVGALITHVDNWALMVGRGAYASPGDNPIIVSNGATGGFGMTTSTNGVNHEGGLINSIGWISSGQSVSSEQLSGDGVTTVFNDQTFRCLSGVITSRQKGVALSGTDTTTPNTPDTTNYIGWNGAHGKFVGNLGYVVFVDVDSGGSAMDDAETALFDEYDLARSFTSIVLPGSGDWTTVDSLSTAASSLGNWVPFSAAEGAAAFLQTSPPAPMTGSAVQIEYKNTTGTVQDRNAGVLLTTPTPIGRDKFWRFTGTVMFDSDIAVTSDRLGKLLYPQQSDNTIPQFWQITLYRNGALSTSSGHVPIGPIPDHEEVGPNIVGLTFAAFTLYTFVIWCRLESALGRGDGYYRVDVNGTKHHEDFNCHYSDANWIGIIDPDAQAWQYFKLGQQFEAGTNFEAIRYWQDLKLETAPVP